MHYFTKVSFANIYRKPSFHSEVDTQSRLWEKLEVSEKIETFYHVRTEDGYRGWINEQQIGLCNPPDRPWALVSTLQTHIYETPQPSSIPLLQVGAGTRLPILERQKEWSKVLLPDERTGWIRNSDLAPMPPLDRQTFVHFARQFLGTTYVWGGKTSFGLDCSGFVQLLYDLFNRPVRRDAWMQFEDAQFVSEDPLEAQPGDLYFFAENSGQKITHVGIALGNGKIIHARGMVRINSLRESDHDFAPQLLKDFVSVKSFFKIEK